MCGIAGYLGAFDPGRLAAMVDAIAHRGPDGKRLWTDPHAGIGLGHVRLAIIDPTSAADQPMIGVGERYVTVFNGEIYNFRALNVMLREHGYSLNDRSDTACLAPLYDLHGVEMLQHLNGMFAFAIWDRQDERLFVARDHAGIKPLYYSRDADRLVFCSELKAVLAGGVAPGEIDPAAIADYVVRLWSPGRRTPLAGIAKLLPGEYMLAGRDGFRQEQWTRPTRYDPGGAPPSLTELSDLFDRIVADQCVSDVPIGAFLSGGVDSTAVVASMVASGNRPDHSYCIGFSGEGMESEGFAEDLPYAQAAARMMDVRLTPIMIAPPDASTFERLAFMLDEPQADPAPLFVEAICQAARADGIKVLMSGVGGDDLFTGYRRHRAAALRSWAGPMAGGLMRMALGSLGEGGTPLRRRAAKLAGLLGGSDDDFVDRCFDFGSRGRALECLSADVRNAAAERSNSYWELGIAVSRGAPLVERVLHQERFGFLPDHNLNYSDKASMASGVEVRVPFLDPRLIELAGRIPWNQKIGLRDDKKFLKQALADRVPRQIRKRRKTGFGAPIRTWIKGPLRPMVADMIASRSFRERGLFDIAAVERAFHDLLHDRADTAYLLLELVMIEYWMRRFLDGTATAGTRAGTVGR